MTRPYRLAWAYEDISLICVLDQLELDHEQRVRAAAALQLWTVAAGWAGLDEDLSTWPEGDPVRLLATNLATHADRTGGKYDRKDDSALGFRLEQALNDILERRDLPAAEDLDDYDAELRVGITPQGGSVSNDDEKKKEQQRKVEEAAKRRQEQREHEEERERKRVEEKRKREREEHERKQREAAEKRERERKERERKERERQERENRKK